MPFWRFSGVSGKPIGTLDFPFSGALVGKNKSELLWPGVVEAITGRAAVIHSGDINKQAVLDRLEEIAPAYGVRGNNDKEWAEHLPAALTFQIEEWCFCLVHNKRKCQRTYPISVRSSSALPSVF